jgi:hypothetical protein
LILRVERKRNPVDEKDIYRQFIDWLSQTSWGLPPADEFPDSPEKGKNPRPAD